MVTIQTKNFGEMQVSEKQKLTFPEGILGFEFIKEYYILDMEESPFYCLQAATEKEIAFILIQPDFFMKDYKLVISEFDLTALDIRNPEEILDFAIVTIPDINTIINFFIVVLLNRATPISIFGANPPRPSRQVRRERRSLLDSLRLRNIHLLRTAQAQPVRATLCETPSRRFPDCRERHRKRAHAQRNGLRPSSLPTGHSPLDAYLLKTLNSLSSS